MNTGILIAGIMTIFTSSVISLICIPLIQGSVKPNKSYGIRIKKAFESEDNWYKINKYGGKLLLYWGILMGIDGVLILLLLIPEKVDQTVLMVFIFSPYILLIPFLVKIFSFSKKL